MEKRNEYLLTFPVNSNCRNNSRLRKHAVHLDLNYTGVIPLTENEHQLAMLLTVGTAPFRNRSVQVLSQLSLSADFHVESR